MTASSFYTDADRTRLNGSPGINAQNELGRSAFRKDYARLLHAPSFRRLQGKTQLFPGVESDFFRNRLTHSLEVAQIAGGIAAALNELEMQTHFPGTAIDCDLVQFAALAHDLGHPPFGHNGEKALDELMKAYGGFEGNAQTLRIVAVTERKLVQVGGGSPSTAFGLNLTYRALASVLKYDRIIPKIRKASDDLVKGYYASEADLVAKIKANVAPAFRGREFKTLECAIMDIADDIAYSTYDLEDSFHAKFLTPFELLHALNTKPAIAAAVLKKTNESLKKAKHAKLEKVDEIVAVLQGVFSGLRGEVQTKQPTTASVVQGAKAWEKNNRFATDSLLRTQFTAERVGELIHAVELVPHLRHPQLSTVRLKRDALLKVEVLKHLNFELIIRSPQLAVVEHRGKDLVRELFSALLESKGALLPSDWKQDFEDAKTKAEKARVVCDYVAGMTDRYAAELHSRLFGKGTTIFKPL